MMNSVGTHRATVADLDAIQSIEQDCFAADGDAFPRRQLHYLVTRAQGACFAATIKGHIVGYIALLTRQGCGNLRIYSIAVAPQARGAGVGQALIDAAIAEARHRALRELTLEVRADNTSAIALYRKNGFRSDRLLRGYYHDGADGRRMVLSLSPDGSE